MADYKAVVVKAGSGGFGGPLTLIPDAKRNKVVNITGGVMSQVAQRLAEMTGCELVDGFKTRVPDDEILVVVIDCGGTRWRICYSKIFGTHIYTLKNPCRNEHKSAFLHTRQIFYKLRGIFGSNKDYVRYRWLRIRVHNSRR